MTHNVVRSVNGQNAYFSYLNTIISQFPQLLAHSMLHFMLLYTRTHNFPHSPQQIPSFELLIITTLIVRFTVCNKTFFFIAFLLFFYIS
jgi:hypothetical protein